MSQIQPLAGVRLGHEDAIIERLRPLLLLAACASPPSLPFDLDTPGMAPGLFAPGIVTTDEWIELYGVIAPDGREFFFTRIDGDGRFVMRRSRWIDGSWTRVEKVPPVGHERMSRTANSEKVLYKLGRRYRSGAPAGHAR